VPVDRHRAGEFGPGRASVDADDPGDLPRGADPRLALFRFYALPEIGVLLPGAVVGVLVLGIVYAAYCAEVYRGALITIPPGLRDASMALGLSPFVMWVRVLVPIACARACLRS